MQNNVLNLTTQAIGSGSLTIDVRKTLPITNAVKPAFNAYYIEDAMITGELVNVEFSLDDKWHTMTIELQALLNFAIDTGLNDYCFDSADYVGEHSQDYGTFDIDTYIDENIAVVVKAYLQSVKAKQINLN